MADTRDVFDNDSRSDFASECDIPAQPVSSAAPAPSELDAFRSEDGLAVSSFEPHGPAVPVPPPVIGEIDALLDAVALSGGTAHAAQPPQPKATGRRQFRLAGFFWWRPILVRWVASSAAAFLVGVLSVLLAMRATEPAWGPPTDVQRPVEAIASSDNDSRTAPTDIPRRTTSLALPRASGSASPSGTPRGIETSPSEPRDPRRPTPDGVAARQDRDPSVNNPPAGGRAAVVAGGPSRSAVPLAQLPVPRPPSRTTATTPPDASAPLQSSPTIASLTSLALVPDSPHGVSRTRSDDVPPPVSSAEVGPPAAPLALERTAGDDAAATTSRGRITSSAPENATEVEEEAVRRLLRSYENAYEDLNVVAAAAVWPSVDRRTLARAFATLKSQSLEFDSCAITVRDGRATAHCHGTLQFVRRVGSPVMLTADQQWVFRLQRVGTEWKIDEVSATQASLIAGQGGS